VAGALRAIEERWLAGLDDAGRRSAQVTVDLDAPRHVCPACLAEFDAGPRTCPECGLRLM
jgi:hypothetical protein